MMPVSEKPGMMQVALSTILPFVIGLCATQVTLVIGERYGRDTLPFVLVGWCVALAVSATWLNRVMYRRTNSFSGCRSSHSFGVVVAKTGVHNARYTFGSHVRIFHDAGGGES
jgi:hypothetical protein